MNVKQKSGWFELSGQLKIDSNLLLDMNTLLDKIGKTGNRFIPLGDGQFIAITKALKKQLEKIKLLASSRGRGIQLPPTAPIILTDLAESIPHFNADKMQQSPFWDIIS